MVNKQHQKFNLFNVITKLFPFFEWFKGYRGEHFKIDLISGVTVALVIIPQSMAYAQLAGLPAYYGLYASFLPPMIAALFGSSRQLATGPVAVVSLMTCASLEPLATAGSNEFIAYAILLAFMVGAFQFILGVLRLGFVLNLLSHPVVNGFTNAAALIIATSQLSKIFGVHVEKGDQHYQTVINVIDAAISYTHLPTLGLAILAFVVMILMKKYVPKLPYVLIAVIITTFISWYFNYEKRETVTIDNVKCTRSSKHIQEYNALYDQLDSINKEKLKLGTELKWSIENNGETSKKTLDLEHTITVLNLDIERIKNKIAETREKFKYIKFKSEKYGNGDIGYCSTDDLDNNKEYDNRLWFMKTGKDKINLNEITFSAGGDVVGVVPSGLPSFEMPHFKSNIILNLLSAAIVISLLGFMEAISIAKAMAAKTGQRLSANQELIGQGMANMVGSFFSSYPVSGSFSRSAVNFQTGAVSGLSSVFTSGFVTITLLFLSPLLYYLPQSVLAAIIMMAVIGLVNVKGFIHSWKAQKYDGIIGIITFLCTLYFAPHLDIGIMIGVALSLVLYIYRGMTPEIAMLSKHPDTTFRNAERHGLAQCKHIAVVRYNGSLIFKNVNYLERIILDDVATMPELKYVVLVGNAINELDASGEYMLATLIDRLREAGYDFYITGVNDAIIDTMKRTLLYYKIGEDHFFRNVSMAIDALYEPAHKNSDESECPLRKVVYIQDLNENSDGKI
jgi:sulfate permease, SulP family